MKSKTLHEQIKKDLENYPIEYLEKKAKDKRYPDNLYKHLAIYNSNTYRDIFTKDVKDFNINDTILGNMEKDLDEYLEQNGVNEEENKYTKALCLYLALICEKPLHPFGDKETYKVYELNNEYYCKDRVKFIKDKNSLCKYCVCKKAIFSPF